jgi:hypothetical protein
MDKSGKTGTSHGKTFSPGQHDDPHHRTVSNPQMSRAQQDSSKMWAVVAALRVGKRRTGMSSAALSLGYGLARQEFGMK